MTNHRDGAGGKTVLTEDGPSRLTCRAIATGRRAPVDRVTPSAVAGLDDEILALYARGMTAREA